MQSIFADSQAKSWPYRFNGSLHVGTVLAGIPADQNKAEAWLKTRMLDNPKDDDQLLRRAVAETMVDLGITQDEAVTKVNELRNLCAFKRDDEGLYIEGRQLKAALKEAVSVAIAAGKVEQKGWGTTRKWLPAFFAEHVFIEEERLHLGVVEPSGVLQQFVHSRFGSSIQYNEYVTDAKLDFTLVTDHPFTPDDWAMIWTTGERQGIGACRSQGYGTYAVTRWDDADEASKPRARTRTRAPKSTR